MRSIHDVIEEFVTDPNKEEQLRQVRIRLAPFLHSPGSAAYERMMRGEGPDLKRWQEEKAVSGFTVESARALLCSVQVFYGEDPEEPEAAQTLNMNDTWGWALAWGEYVPDEQLIEVAELFCAYGWAGCLYWVSERNERLRSEFHDINRYVDFVRQEEEFIQRTPDSVTRAYTPYSYTLDGAPEPAEE